MKVSIILPTYNERKNILLLVNSIKKYLNNYNYEIVIIDDNSPDQTAYICKKKFLKNKNIKIIENKIRIGLAKSIFKAIKLSKNDKLVVMDTDFTHNPILIPKMLRLSKLKKIF